MDDTWKKQTKTLEALKWIVDIHGLEATCNMDSKATIHVYVTRRDMESLCELIKEYLPSKTIYRSIQYTLRAMGASYTLKPSVEEYIRTQTQPPTVYDPMQTIFVIRDWDAIDTMVHGPLFDLHGRDHPSSSTRTNFPQKWSS
jgi:hypothetical protein